MRADADLDFAVENLVDGAYFNSGQSCCGIERIYVDRNDPRRILSRPSSSSPASTSSAIRWRKTPRSDRWCARKPPTACARRSARRVKKGAKALLQLKDKPRSPYLPPEVLIDVDHGMAVMTEESFGPVVGIQPVKDDEEAISLMNDSRYGLTASIWTQDADAALRIGERVETGTWFMNRCDYLDPALAWTGVKDSGRGCTLSKLGLETFTRPKSFHLRLTV